tara:strand:+ start:9967 stop:11103 length:1137 start_codon:yes stop_codon:yes gene_type:complete
MKNHIKIKKKILLWSPMLSHVGTIKAVRETAINLSENNQVFLINNFGDKVFDVKEYANIKEIIFFNSYKIMPKNGLISKFLIYFFSFLSIPQLIFFIKKNKINLIITHLVGIVPLILKFIFKDLKIFCSIQGFPKMNKLRKFLWKVFYNKSDLIITMSDMSKNLISPLIKEKSKIIKINNPIISYKLIKKSKEKIEDEYKEIFKKKNMISIGRLTKQKNHIEILMAYKDFQKKFDNINLVIIGEGELKNKINKIINKYNIKNVFLLGYKNNPFKYLSNSDLYVSSSLWEDPGHSLIESAFLRVPILTSDCPAAPKEIFVNNINCLQYKTGNIESLKLAMIKFFSGNNENQIRKNKISARELALKFTKKEFKKNIFNYI